MVDPVKRLRPSTETIKKLLLRSGNECAFPDCSEVLFNDNDELIAECCHIQAALPGGERFNSEQTDKERRSQENLIFLCHKHHVETNNVSLFPTDLLAKIKEDHEQKFKEKPISINPKYIKEVSASFDEILTHVKSTSDIAKRLEIKQDKLLDLLSEKIKQEPPLNVANEYFGTPPIFQFKGRKNELADMGKNFKKYNTLLVGGISGIGKTSFISTFLKKKNKNKVLWIDCKIVKTEEVFLLNLARLIKQEFNDNALETIISKADQPTIYAAVVSYLRNYHTCIVLDALNTTTHELHALIRYLNGHLINSRIIITTNHDFDTAAWSNPVWKINLNGVNDDDFIAILKTYGKYNITSDDAIIVHKLIHGHPFLIKLIASIIRFKPVDVLITSLKDLDSNEVSSYIQSIVFEQLNTEEIGLIQQLAVFGIPFRYSIIKHFKTDSFSHNFKSLQQKFLIEDFRPNFFIVPEFIRSYALNRLKIGDLTETYRSATAYLLSISDTRVFERNALIYHALKANLNDVAYKGAIGFLIQLMAKGEFNLANKVVSELETDPTAGTWSYIYYIKGRIFRFRNDFENALIAYERGLSIDQNTEYGPVLKFEKASILTYLSKDGDNLYLQDAIEIYEQLADSTEDTMRIQSKVSLAAILMHSNEYGEAINKLEALTNSVDPNNTKENVLASMWQMLGTAYSKIEDFQQASICFEKSMAFYKGAVEHFGMNTIDGLYNLYDNYAWSLANNGNYLQAVELFESCVGLCVRFDLGNKLDNALFDYGFHLAMAGEYERARHILTEHYSFIVEHDFVEGHDMNLIYGTLCFVHWYSNAFIDAVELLALYIISCYEIGGRPAIAITENQKESEEIEILKFFQKRTYILMLPSEHSISDLNGWIDVVCDKNPNLKGPLTQLVPLTKE